jgi:tetratricopeptide (TPR) repeat protein
VKADPRNAGALSVLGDVLAAVGDYEAARDAYADALTIAPNPGDLIATGNIARVLGDDDAAQAAYGEAENMITATVETRRAHARTWANHLLDNGGDAALALTIAEDELATRTDTAGWETYAWALFKNGRLGEAREAIDVALERGLDAHGYYRAGAISAARGETERAIAELTTALDLSPRFHPIDATVAAALLAELG